jgi:hypothetical protein
VSVLFAERPPRPLAPVRRILIVLVFGIVLVFVPWISFLGLSWESNWLLQVSPAFRGFVLNPFTRGAVTGLGLVNVLLAFRDTYERLLASGGRD